MFVTIQPSAESFSQAYTSPRPQASGRRNSNTMPNLLSDIMLFSKEYFLLPIAYCLG